MIPSEVWNEMSSRVILDEFSSFALDGRFVVIWGNGNGNVYFFFVVVTS